jgi:hypothetical protein
MSEYVDKLDALDILDQFEDAVENGEGGSFYSKAREMMGNLPSEEIIHCKDCVYYCNILRADTQFESGECDAVDEFYIADRKPYDFCSMARLKK